MKKNNMMTSFEAYCANIEHDDSLPYVSPVPRPHLNTVYQQLPSVPDLSVCDSSFVIESKSIGNDEKRSGRAEEEVYEQKKSITKGQHRDAEQKIDLKHPRSTKASLARMALTQPSEYLKKNVNTKSAVKSKSNVHKNIPRGNNKKLAINFQKPIQIEGKFVSKPVSKKSPLSNKSTNIQSPPTAILTKSPPTAIFNDYIQESPSVNYVEDHPSMQFNDTVSSVGNKRNFQSYCPEDYSDLNDDESFILTYTPKQQQQQGTHDVGMSNNRISDIPQQQLDVSMSNVGLRNSLQQLQGDTNLPNCRLNDIPKQHFQQDPTDLSNDRLVYSPQQQRQHNVNSRNSNLNVIPNQSQRYRQEINMSKDSFNTIERKCNEQHFSKETNNRDVNDESVFLNSEQVLNNDQVNIEDESNKHSFNWSLIDIENGSIISEKEEITNSHRSIGDGNNEFGPSQPKAKSAENIENLQSSEQNSSFKNTISQNRLDTTRNKELHSVANSMERSKSLEHTVNHSNSDDEFANQTNSSDQPANQTSESSSRKDDSKPLSSEANSYGTESMMNLMLHQQKQLEELQKQLQRYLSYHTQPPCDVNTQDTIKDELVQLHEKQQHQIDRIQQQVHQFIQDQSPKPSSPKPSSPNTKKSESSTQYTISDLPATSTTPKTNDTPRKTTCVNTSTLSIADTPSKSVGVNTSMTLWPSENMSSTFSDTKLRGQLQAEGYGGRKKHGVCACACPHSNRNVDVAHSKAHSQSNSLNNTSSMRGNVSSPNLSDIKDDDFTNRSMFNDTASSSRTLASPVKVMDMTAYAEESDNEGEEETPIKNASKMAAEWNKSPVLGESASALIEHQQDTEGGGIDEGDNQEFCANIMDQVQSFIEAQHIKPNDKNMALLSNNGQHMNNADKSNTRRSLKETTFTCESNEETNPNDDGDNGYRQLDIGDNHYRQRSHSQGFLQHAVPKINYVTMSSLDDTICEYGANDIDDIASKYLSKDFMTQIKNNIPWSNEIRNKTVKFQGVYQRETNRQMTTTSVNFSCNMSIASRKYLQKYDLNADQRTMEKTIEKRVGPANIKTKEKIETQIRKNDINKENILDFKKLRTLSKLK